MLFSLGLRSLKGKFPFPSTPGQVHNSSWITPGSNSSPGADVSICQSLFGEFQSASTSIVNFTFKWVSVLCDVQAFPLRIKSVSSVSVLDWGEKNMQVVHLLTADHCLQGRIVWTGEWEWGWDSFQILWEVRGDISCLPFSPLLLHNSVTTQFSECWQVPWAVAARQKLVHTRYYLPHHRQDLSSSQILHPPVWIMTQSALPSPLPYNSLTLPAIILTCQAGDGESDSRLD